MQGSAQTHRGEQTLERRSGALRVAVEDPSLLCPRRPSPMIVEGGSDIFEFMDTDANFLDSPLVWQPPERMSPNLPGLLRLQGTSPPRACNQPSGAEATPSSRPVQSSWPRRLTVLRSTKEVWQNPFSTCQRPPSDLDPNTAPHFVSRSACQRLLASVRTGFRRPV